MSRLAVIIFLVLLVGCTKPPQADAPAVSAAQPPDLGHIPAADPSKYPKFTDMSSWKNPYLVVREDGIGMVDLSNHEIHVLTLEQVPARLVALPTDAWPYGRAVLVTEVKPANPTDEIKTKLRENRALLLGTLKDLDVQHQEVP